MKYIDQEKHPGEKASTTSEHIPESNLCSQIPSGIFFLFQEHFQILLSKNRISTKTVAIMKENLNLEMAAILKEDLNIPRKHMPVLSKKTWTNFNSIENFF